MAKVKIAAGWLSETLEAACGWALCALALYAVLFVDLSGNGRLWDAARALWADAKPAPAAHVFPVAYRRVPARPADEAASLQDRMLMVPEVPKGEITVPVLAPEAPAPAAAAEADVPAAAPAPSPARDWRRHIRGELRTFTVYGEGEQRSSASASVSAPAARSQRPVRAAASAPTPAALDSAYRVAGSAAVRPGIGDHVVRASADPADGVRNFR